MRCVNWATIHFAVAISLAMTGCSDSGVGSGEISKHGGDNIWVVETSLDPFEDRQRISAKLGSIEKLTPKHSRYFLEFRCDENGGVAEMFWGGNVKSHKEILTRVDDSPPVKNDWYIEDTGMFTYHKFPREFFYSLEGGDRLAIRTISNEGVATTAEFDLSGFDQIKDDVIASCE